MSATTSTDPSTIVAFQFASAPRAAEFVSSAVRLDTEGHILVNDLVLLEARPDGKVHAIETNDVTTRGASIDGAVWGGLLGILFGGPIIGLAVGAGLGALRGKRIDLGISNEFVDSLRDQVEPGKFAVVMLVSHIDNDIVLKELERFPGTELIASTLAVDAVDAVRDAVEGDD